MRRSICASAAILLPAMLAVSHSAMAQEPVADLAADISDGSHVNLGVDAGLTYTDNFFSQNSVHQAAFGGLVKPTVGYTFAIPRFRFTSDLGGEFAIFDLPTTTDDYADGNFTAGLEWRSALRHRFGYTGRLQYDHDQFGTDRTEGSIFGNRKLDKYRVFGGEARYRYGLPTAPINVDVRIGAGDKEYLTNRADGTEFLDFEKQVAQLTLLYNLSPKTALLADVVAGRTAFDNTPPGGSRNRDGIDLHYRVGAHWQATAKTSGDVRVGLVERRSKDSTTAKFSEPDWQGTVNWLPLSYTQLTFQVGRRVQESYLINVDFLDNRYYQVEWSFDWTARIVTRVLASYAQTEFVGSPVPRNDDYGSVGVTGEYRATRQLSLLASGGYYERTSSLDPRGYDKVTAYLGLRYVR